MTINWPLQPSDLGVYLGIDQVDTVRGQLMLDLSLGLCQSIVNPVPQAAAGVVLSVAARAFTNARQLSDANLGTAHVQYAQAGGGAAVGGLYLSRADKSALRRAAGGSSAFSADTLPPGVNAVQTITVTATAGTFTLAFGSQATAPIAYNATASAVLSALTALGNIGSGNITVTGDPTAFAVTFINVLGTCVVPMLTANGAGLTGTVSVAQTTQGVLAPGQGLPPWDMDYSARSGTGYQYYGGPL